MNYTMGFLQNGGAKVRRSQAQQAADEQKFRERERMARQRRQTHPAGTGNEKAESDASSEREAQARREKASPPRGQARRETPTPTRGQARRETPPPTRGQARREKPPPTRGQARRENPTPTQRAMEKAQNRAERGRSRKPLTTPDQRLATDPCYKIKGEEACTDNRDCYWGIRMRKKDPICISVDNLEELPITELNKILGTLGGRVGKLKLKKDIIKRITHLHHDVGRKQSDDDDGVSEYGEDDAEEDEDEDDDDEEDEGEEGDGADIRRTPQRQLYRHEQLDRDLTTHHGDVLRHHARLMELQGEATQEARDAREAQQRSNKAYTELGELNDSATKIARGRRKLVEARRRGDEDRQDVHNKRKFYDDVVDTCESIDSPADWEWKAVRPEVGDETCDYYMCEDGGEYHPECKDSDPDAYLPANYRQRLHDRKQVLLGNKRRDEASTRISSQVRGRKARQATAPVRAQRKDCGDATDYHTWQERGCDEFSESHPGDKDLRAHGAELKDSHEFSEDIGRAFQEVEDEDEEVEDEDEEDEDEEEEEEDDEDGQGSEVSGSYEREEERARVLEQRLRGVNPYDMEVHDAALRPRTLSETQELAKAREEEESDEDDAMLAEVERVAAEEASKTLAEERNRQTLAEDYDRSWDEEEESVDRTPISEADTETAKEEYRQFFPAIQKLDEILTQFSQGKDAELYIEIKKAFGENKVLSLSPKEKDIPINTFNVGKLLNKLFGPRDGGWNPQIFGPEEILEALDNIKVKTIRGKFGDNTIAYLIGEQLESATQHSFRGKIEGDSDDSEEGTELHDVDSRGVAATKLQRLHRGRETRGMLASLKQDYDRCMDREQVNSMDDWSRDTDSAFESYITGGKTTKSNCTHLMEQLMHNPYAPVPSTFREDLQKRQLELDEADFDRNEAAKIMQKRIRGREARRLVNERRELRDKRGEAGKDLRKYGAASKCLATESQEEWGSDELDCDSIAEGDVPSDLWGRLEKHHEGLKLKQADEEREAELAKERKARDDHYLECLEAETVPQWSKKKCETFVNDDHTQHLSGEQLRKIRARRTSLVGPDPGAVHQGTHHRKPDTTSRGKSQGKHHGNAPLNPARHRNHRQRANHGMSGDGFTPLG